MENIVCLADGCVMSGGLEHNGINENRLIVGTTRCGKTFSIVEPMLLHTYEGSLVVTITKRALFDKYSRIFKERGYEVLDLNFANPERSNVCYDPIKYLKTDSDFINIGRVLADICAGGMSDPYWKEASAACITALFKLVSLNSMTANKSPSFIDFKCLFSNLNLKFEKMTETNLDVFFDEAEKRYPGNIAWQKWKTISTASPKTAACIESVLNASLDDFFDNSLMEMMGKERKLSFEEIGSKKTILFVTTSPFNKSSERMTTLFYYDLFRNLFEFAEKCPDKILPTPVNIICDDFATGSKIPDFAEHISVFCAKRISVTLLLQSESQLEGMYTPSEAKTIINNCDTYVYMGGMDDMTCHSISRRINKPVEDIFFMPLEQVIVMRRGSKPVISRRYQTMEDPLYKELCM